MVASLRARANSAGRHSILLGLLIAVIGAAPLNLPAQEHQPVAIAAASDLVFCLDELDARFQQEHPSAKLELTTGSSGNFYAQIRRGAPFDIFLSADTRYPRELVKAGRADGSSLTVYAVGRIVLWTTRKDLALTNGLFVLTNAAVRRFAIANPEHAPYGRAARAALEHEQLWSTLNEKIVLGENIAQTVQYVQSGNVDAGIVALSLVSAPKLKKTGAWWLVPEKWHPRLEQGAVLTGHAAKNPMAKAYLEFLQSREAREMFDRYGFHPPQKP